MNENKTKSLLVIILSAYLIYLLLRNIYFISISWNELYKIEDFNHYYSTSFLIDKYDKPYEAKFKDSSIFKFFEYHSKIQQATNPPLLALIIKPITILTPKEAWLAFLIINILSIITLFITVYFFKFNFSIKEQVLIFLLFITSDPTYKLIVYSQFQGISLLICIFAIIQYLKGKEVAGIFLISLATALKFHTWPLWIFFALDKFKLKNLAYSFLSLVALLLIPVFFLNLNIYFDFYKNAYPLIINWANTSSNNYAILFTAKKLFLSFNIQNYEAYHVFYKTIVFIGVFGIIAYLLKNKTSLKSFLILLLISFVLGPVAWPHYYLVAFFPLVYIYYISKKSISRLTLAIIALTFGASNFVNIPNSSNVVIPKLFNPFSLFNFSGEGDLLSSLLNVVFFPTLSIVIIVFLLRNLSKDEVKIQ